MADKIKVLVVGAKKLFESWLAAGRGISVWESVDLSDPGKQWFTPGDVSKPHWKCGNLPTLHTDINDFQFITEMKEIKRFHVAVRLGSQGLSLKVSDGGTRRIRRELEKAGPDAYYIFDYGTQSAIIQVPVYEGS